jgi:hypothetical protein
MVLGVQRPSPLCISGLMRLSKGKGHEVKNNLNDQPLITRLMLKTSRKRWLQHRLQLGIPSPYEIGRIVDHMLVLGKWSHRFHFF